MRLLICCFYSAFTLFAACILTVRSEAQHCMNRISKDISVEIGDDNPQRVMSFVRDKPGYQVNLQCKWTLQPANYDNSRQMYIRVPVIDFDTNDVSEAQCNISNPRVDILTFSLKRNLRERETNPCNGRQSTYMSMQTSAEEKPQYMCSSKSFKIKEQIVNLWDPSYKLALEFRSDDKQVRSNAKGVQVDVQVLGRDYCHRTMLFFEGSCYLITPELAPAEAFNISKNYLGNVFTVPRNRNDSEFFRPFIQRNNERSGEFPFESPLSLVGRKMWTGYFVDLPAQSPVNCALFMNPAKKCCQERRNMTVYISSTINQAVEPVCAVAMVITSGSRVNFTCESLSSKLPALIEFKQIPATKGDTHPQLFTTCDTLPSFRLCPTTTRPQEQQLNNLQRQQLSLQRQQLSLMQQQLSLQQQQLSLLLQQFNLQEQQLNIQ